MAKQKDLSVELRTTLGKTGMRELRESGLVPGVFYDSKGQNLAVQVRELPLSKLFGQIGSSHVFNLHIKTDAGEEVRPCFIWDMQRHPVKSRIIHVDFYGVDLEKHIRIDVPVEIQGEAPGVKNGGVLELFRDTITVECLPLDIPEHIRIDVSALELGQSVSIEEVELPGNVQKIYDEAFAVVGVLAPSTEEEGGAEEAEEAEAAE